MLGIIEKKHYHVYVKMQAPNVLTYSRIVMTPIVSFLLIKGLFLTAWALLCAASITDYLDGFLAKKFHFATPFGGFLDAFADKILVTTTGMTLIAIEPLDGLLFVPYAIILWREIFISSIRMLPGPTQKSRTLPRIKTLVQTSALGLLIGGKVFPCLHIYGLILLWIACLLSLMSTTYYWKKVTQFYYKK